MPSGKGKNYFGQFDGGAGQKAAERGKKKPKKASNTARVAGEPKADDRSTSGITEEGILTDMRANRRAVLRGGI